MFKIIKNIFLNTFLCVYYLCFIITEYVILIADSLVKIRFNALGIYFTMFHSSVFM